MNVLITGVAGFIGSNLAEYLLSKDYRVMGIDDLSYGVKEQVPERVEFHKMNICSEGIFDLFGDIDTIFHFAAKNCISDCQLDPVETTKINIFGTVNVLEACKRNNVKKVILAESSALYEASEVFPTSEENEAPQSFYAVSKLCGNLLANGYRRFSGMNISALRYFNVYGPRQDYRRTVPPLMSGIIIRLLKGERSIIYGDGTKRRDFIYVDDVNRFHEMILFDERTNGKVFNLGSGVNYSVLEIYEAIESILETGLKPVFKPDLPGEAFQNLADISKAESLGWKPRVSLEEGLRLSIDYIRENVLNTMELTPS
jgi:UDP-glucose 4-epimerase|tara:strand:- start:349 stop:1290 length:942 start_codon:yes stop_codon:yes gene_type:complete